MTEFYSAAREAQLKQDIRDMDEIRPVLAQLGARLTAYGPGVTARATLSHFTREVSLKFDYATWAWVWPLLKELVELRRSKT